MKMFRLVPSGNAHYMCHARMDESWKVLLDVISMHHVVYVHMAPPWYCKSCP